MNRKTGIVLSAIIAIIAGLWVWAAVIPKDSIQIGGSTSVSNVMTNLEEAYKTYQEENNKDKKPDQFLYSSVGSSGGINSAKSGTYKMGFISKYLDDSVNYVDASKNADLLTKVNDAKDIPSRQEAIENYFIESKKTASDDDMHYVQIATDAIIVVYQAPDWFTKKENGFVDKFNIEFKPDGTVSDAAKELMQNIYSGTYKWSQLAEKINPEGKTKIDEKNDAVIQPFAGAAGSGTRTVFDKTFDLLPPANAKQDDIRVKDQMAPSVGPSDGFMYSSINANTIGYLSMNYLTQIKNNEKLHAMYVGGVDPKSATFGEKGNIDDQYKLTRPYIGLIKAKSSDSDLRKIADFLGWIADASINKDGDVGKQYSSALIAPTFKLDSSDLLPKGDKPKQEKAEEHSSTTNSELKQNILNAYVRKD